MSQIFFTGKLLFAMPSMNDIRFHDSVIIINEHSNEEASGIIINKPTENAHVKSLFSQIGYNINNKDMLKPILFGGPMNLNKGMIIHSSEFNFVGSKEINDQLSISTNPDLLDYLAYLMLMQNKNDEKLDDEKLDDEKLTIIENTTKNLTNKANETTKLVNDKVTVKIMSTEDLPHTEGLPHKVTKASTSKASTSKNKNLLTKNFPTGYSKKLPLYWDVILGQAKWEAGQLEHEVAHNSWLTLPTSKDILYHYDYDIKWNQCFQALGINKNMFYCPTSKQNRPN